MPRNEIPNEDLSAAVENAGKNGLVREKVSVRLGENEVVEREIYYPEAARSLSETAREEFERIMVDKTRTSQRLDYALGKADQIKASLSEEDQRNLKEAAEKVEYLKGGIETIDTNTPEGAQRAVEFAQEIDKTHARLFYLIKKGEGKGGTERKKSAEKPLKPADVFKTLVDEGKIDEESAIKAGVVFYTKGSVKGGMRIVTENAAGMPLKDEQGRELLQLLAQKSRENYKKTIEEYLAEINKPVELDKRGAEEGKKGPETEPQDKDPEQEPEPTDTEKGEIKKESKEPINEAQKDQLRTQAGIYLGQIKQMSDKGISLDRNDRELRKAGSLNFSPRGIRKFLELLVNHDIDGYWASDRFALDSSPAGQDAENRARNEKTYEAFVNLLKLVATDIRTRIDSIETELNNKKDLPPIQPGPWFKVLGVDPKASRKEVRRAYKDLVRLYHTDTSKSSNDDLNIRLINNAWDEYEHPKKRKAHGGKDPSADGSPPPPPGRGPEQAEADEGEDGDSQPTEPSRENPREQKLRASLDKESVDKLREYYLRARVLRGNVARGKFFSQKFTGNRKLEIDGEEYYFSGSQGAEELSIIEEVYRKKLVSEESLEGTPENERQAKIVEMLQADQEKRDDFLSNMDPGFSGRFKRKWLRYGKARLAGGLGFWGASMAGLAFATNPALAAVRGVVGSVGGYMAADSLMARWKWTGLSQKGLAEDIANELKKEIKSASGNARTTQEQAELEKALDAIETRLNALTDEELAKEAARLQAMQIEKLASISRSSVSGEKTRLVIEGIMKRDRDAKAKKIVEQMPQATQAAQFASAFEGMLSDELKEQNKTSEGFMDEERKRKAIRKAISATLAVGLGSVTFLRVSETVGAAAETGEGAATAGDTGASIEDVFRTLEEQAAKNPTLWTAEALRQYAETIGVELTPEARTAEEIMTALEESAKENPTLWTDNAHEVFESMMAEQEGYQNFEGISQHEYPADQAPGVKPEPGSVQMPEAEHVSPEEWQAGDRELPDAIEDVDKGEGLWETTRDMVKAGKITETEWQEAWKNTYININGEETHISKVDLVHADDRLSFVEAQGDTPAHFEFIDNPEDSLKPGTDLPWEKTSELSGEAETSGPTPESSKETSLGTTENGQEFAHAIKKATIYHETYTEVQNKNPYIFKNWSFYRKFPAADVLAGKFDGLTPEGRAFTTLRKSLERLAEESGTIPKKNVFGAENLGEWMNRASEAVAEDRAGSLGGNLSTPIEEAANDNAVFDSHTVEEKDMTGENISKNEAPHAEVAATSSPSGTPEKAMNFSGWKAVFTRDGGELELQIVENLSPAEKAALLREAETSVLEEDFKEIIEESYREKIADGLGVRPNWLGQRGTELLGREVPGAIERAKEAAVDLLQLLKIQDSLPEYSEEWYEVESEIKAITEPSGHPLMDEYYPDQVIYKGKPLDTKIFRRLKELRDAA